jgi:hypothetical protein
MREDSVREYLRKAGAAWSPVDRLRRGGKLVEAKCKDRLFYITKLVRAGGSRKRA